MNIKKAVVFALSLLTLTACGGKATAEVTSSSSSSVELDAKGMEVVRFTGLIDGHETYYAGFPKKFGASSDKKGSLVKIDYQTSVYDAVYDKHVNVYLPYGYNQEDTSKKYNVIYMEHGNKRSVDDLVHVGEETQFQRELDNLFDPDKAGIDPSIVVFTSFYLDDTRTIAGDGFTNEEGSSDKFHLEVVNDIIPLVESQYNTYLEGKTLDAIHASRSHRAFTGYSRGGACTWYMLKNQLESFQYFAPMSGSPALFTDGSEEAFEGIWTSFKDNFDSHPDLPYFVYPSGGKKEAASCHPWVNFLTKKTDYFTWSTTNTNKGICYAVSKLDHHDEYAPTYYYNTLKVFFH